MSKPLRTGFRPPNEAAKKDLRRPCIAGNQEFGRLWAGVRSLFHAWKNT